ncbi:uncharacterized protein BJ171DRAFT_620920 [Polychytrium aggregatum]|uniref:uncharacterized protein n=1 Tax=Polychytrium aggregatum TaxID=110093 RepID=UPI0022FEE367|nr:uncharacterized protein BJ171DRAFT_620920 [Polychytrium aggregatum]KAI9209465.1 hypothetical protein BJ171DRAFT_620920 [Polychytrium aggregatum]
MAPSTSAPTTAASTPSPSKSSNSHDDHLHLNYRRSHAPFNHTSRKQLSPKRSVPSSMLSDKERNKIVRLDVYEKFLNNPAILLYNLDYRKRALEAVQREQDQLKDADMILKETEKTRGGGRRQRGRPGNARARAPFEITELTEGFAELSSDEVAFCTSISLNPRTYIKGKKALILEYETRGPFKKKDAHRVCRIDANKSGKLYDWIIKQGWM